MSIYWIITVLYFIFGTVTFWCILSSKWKKLDPFVVSMLDSFRVFHPIPGYPGYMDLKFTIIRHSVVFLLSAAAIYWIKAKFVLNCVLFLNILYAGLPISRYRARKKDLEETAKRPNGSATVSFISVPVKDSFCTVVFSVLCVVVLYILFAIRP